MSSRSALASGTGVLAETWGAKPGRMVRAAAMNAATATAERALIMTVPCNLSLSVCFGGPFVGRIDNRPWFRDIFASHEKRFHHAKNCFNLVFRTKQNPEICNDFSCPLTYDKTRTPPQRFDRRQEINIDGSPEYCGTRPACGP
jgi:hypothetical protein